MLRNRITISLLAVLAASLIFAGCGSQPAKTAPPAQSAIGVVNMDKAVKAHPKYAEVQRLQKDYAALAAQLDAENAQGVNGAGLPPAGNASGLEQAAAKEFDARMAAKETEVKTRLQAAADQMNRDMAAELDAYARQVEQEYQPALFSLQLKLKTVQLSKEEAAAIQTDVDKLQKEQAAKIAARQKELADKANAAMKAKQSDAEKELAAYAQTVNSELTSKLPAQQADIAGRMAPPVQNGGGAAEADKLAAAGRDISTLQDYIINDIRDKAAKVAAEKGLDTVLAEVKVNVNATDITDAVIAEIKK